MHKFCKDHRRYEDHECTAPRDDGKVKTQVLSIAEINRRKDKCQGCRKKLTALNKTICEHCSLPVCLKHRFQSDHNCVGKKASRKKSKILQRNSGIQRSLEAHKEESKTQEVDSEFLPNGKCPTCGEEFADFVKLINHCEEHLLQEVSVHAACEEEESCPICQNKYPVSELVSHCEIVHALA
ncbi:unnamed protein product [Moneuplotes crassus]|uniref:AN1-type domain-containing protein n=1 Tax=Euplotes crassus TaxID=5936 RepID=A0AAD1XWH4_EUPCR|nr:unnamed protein product [Moneuplotes crassus]